MTADLSTPTGLVDIEAEMCAIGAMLISTEAADRVLSIVPDDAFYQPAHQKISAAVREIRARNEPIDLVLVRDELTKTGDLRAVGDMQYVAQCAEAVPTASNAVYYAEIVLEKRDLRLLDDRAKALAKATRAGDVATATTLAHTLTDGLYTRSNVISFESVLETAKKGLEPGVPLFIPEINNLLDARGLMHGLLHGYCAETGKGKSTFLCQQAVHALQQGERVGIVTLEMSASDIVMKMIRQMTGFVSQHNAACHGDDCLDDYNSVVNLIRDWMADDQLAFLDGAENGQTESQVFAWLNSQAKKGYRTFIIDYVQDILPEPKVKADYAFHTALSKRLRNWAQKERAMVLGLFQIQFISKYGKNEFEFKGCSQYFRDCNTIIVKTLERKDESGHADEFLNIPKNRYGRTGRVQVFFDPKTQRVTS